MTDIQDAGEKSPLEQNWRRPAAVTAGVVLGLAPFVLSLLAGAFSDFFQLLFLTIKGLFSDDPTNGLGKFLGLLFVISFVITNVIIPTFLFIKIWARKNWARLIFVVYAVLLIAYSILPYFLFNLHPHPHPRLVPRPPAPLQLVIAEALLFPGLHVSLLVASIVMLFRPSSSRWFKAKSK